MRFVTPRLLLAAAALMLAGCAAQPPSDPDDLCSVFRERPAWHEAATEAAGRWGAPVHLPLAILHQESGFRAKARPPMRWFLGVVPYGRASSAYGYAQAKDETWEAYRESSGNGWADRDDFGDAVDFVQWYIDRSHRLNGTAKTDAFAQYLNYHEGWGGYRRASYRAKPGLLAVARKVEARAARYGRQYAGCRDELDRGFLERLFGG